jgi:hypothetical protein
MADQRSSPASGPEIARLGALVGRWRSEGRVAGDPPELITGTDTYEWLPGGFFIIHHVDVEVGGHTVQAIEIIGERDPATDAFIARAYDNDGNVTIMRATVGAENVWTFTGGGDIAPAAELASAKAAGAVRSTLTVSADGQRMSARWERSDDGSVWERWMDMTFTRLP